mmetsp:Transcript_105324/g.209338  ORF Transcript_105324/g.209338 Transcript_105324/m.209338 type:complete len:273 (+) Transcript_105324:446-1264(+)
MSVTAWPSPFMVLARSNAICRVLTKMMLCPTFKAPYRSHNCFVFFCSPSPTSMYVCLTVESVRSSFSTMMVCARGTIFRAKVCTRSGNVAEKRSTCRSSGNRLLIWVTWGPIWLSSSIKTSASSSTKILVHLPSATRRLSKSMVLPGVPTMMFAFILRGRRSSWGTAKNKVKPVNFPNREITSWFCNASSRVGHTQRPCSPCVSTSHFNSMAKAKAAVLPDPFCAWPTMLPPLSARGSAHSWIFEGFTKPISKMPSSTSFGRVISSHDLAAR